MATRPDLPNNLHRGASETGWSRGTTAGAEPVERFQSPGSAGHYDRGQATAQNQSADAAPENTIGEARARAADESQDKRETPSPHQRRAAEEPDKRRAIPDRIAERFFITKDGRYLHHRDSGELAIVDDGNRLKAKSNNIDVIRSVVEIAQAREWAAIAVTGTEGFRRQVWREAALRGIDARGYEPSDVERAETTAKLERKNAPKASKPKSAHPDRITGTIVAVGIAVPYQFKDENKLTDYITIKQDNGREVTRWGNDIGRALSEATALDAKIAFKEDGSAAFPGVIGQRVAVGDIGTQPYRASKDSPESKRKIFVIDSPEAFDARREATLAEFAPAKSKPERTAEDNTPTPESRAAAERGNSGPGLAPAQPEGADGHFKSPRKPAAAAKAPPSKDDVTIAAYAHIAKLFAEKELHHQEDRTRFVDAVIKTLADMKARGEKVPVPKLREKAATREREEAAMVH